MEQHINTKMNYELVNVGDILYTPNRYGNGWFNKVIKINSKTVKVVRVKTEQRKTGFVDESGYPEVLYYANPDIHEYDYTHGRYDEANIKKTDIYRAGINQLSYTDFDYPR